MGIGEGDEVEPKGILNIFNKKIIEYFQNLEEELSIQVQEASRTPDLTKLEPLHSILSLKQLPQRTENKYLRL
jgi:hypothetical protein